MLKFTLLDIIACSASFGRRYRTRAIGYNQDMTRVDLEPHPTAGLLLAAVQTAGPNIPAFFTVDYWR
jgi:hypothetical protein